MTDMGRYIEACNYPGLLDEGAVDDHLRAYVKTLGIKREVVRLRAGWTLDQHPSLLQYLDAVLDDFAKRTGRMGRTPRRDASTARDARAARAASDVRAALDVLDARVALDAHAAIAAHAALDARAARAASTALDARAASTARDARDVLDARVALDAHAAIDALDALDARDARAIAPSRAAMERFARWCIQACGWTWWRFDLSWIATTHLGALQNKSTSVQRWSKPLFEAYIAGAWFIHWTEDTLYWAAKPIVHKEEPRRLHNDSGPALESDIENLYFWHGVMVPAFVVTRPDWIMAKHITTEENAEVRRVMLERFGMERYLSEGDFAELHRDDWGTLYQEERTDGEQPLTVVKVVNSTPELGGHYKDYILPVHPEIRLLYGDGRPPGPPQKPTALNAIASTFGLTGSEYAKVGQQT